MPRLSFLAPLAAAAVLALPLAGCTDASQLDDAAEDLQEERAETAEEMADAREDGIMDEDDAEDVREELGEDAAARGELAEQQGEYIEGKTD